MSSITSTSAGAGEWTLVFTSEASDASIGLQAVTPGVDVAVRIGTDVDVSDDLNASHIVVEARERVSLSGLSNGDKVLVRPTEKRPSVVSVWA